MRDILQSLLDVIEAQEKLKTPAETVLAIVKSTIATCLKLLHEVR